MLLFLGQVYEDYLLWRWSQLGLSGAAPTGEPRALQGCNYSVRSGCQFASGRYRNCHRAVLLQLDRRHQHYDPPPHHHFAAPAKKSNSNNTNNDKHDDHGLPLIGMFRCMTRSHSYHPISEQFFNAKEPPPVPPNRPSSEGTGAVAQIRLAMMAQGDSAVSWLVRFWQFLRGVIRPGSVSL